MHEAKPGENQVQASKSPLPLELHRTCLIPPEKIVTAHVKCCLPGKLLGDSVPRDFIGALHIGTICQAFTKIPDPLKENRCSA